MARDSSKPSREERLRRRAPRPSASRGQALSNWRGLLEATTCCSHGPPVLKDDTEAPASCCETKGLGLGSDPGVVKITGTHPQPRSTTVPKTGEGFALPLTIRLGESLEAGHLAQMMCESREKRRTVVDYAFDRLPTAADLRWLQDESIEKLRAVLALQIELGLKQGVIMAMTQYWPEELLTKLNHVSTDVGGREAQA